MSNYLYSVVINDGQTERVVDFWTFTEANRLFDSVIRLRSTFSASIMKYDEEGRFIARVSHCEN